MPEKAKYLNLGIPGEPKLRHQMRIWLEGTLELQPEDSPLIAHLKALLDFLNTGKAL